MLFHPGIELFAVDGHARPGGEGLGQLDEKAIGLVQIEGLIAGDLSTTLRSGGRRQLLEFSHSPFNNVQELVLFFEDHVGDRFG